MIRFYEAGIKEIDELMELRKTMLREVNSLPDDYVFSKAFRRDSKKIFLSGNQTTLVASTTMPISSVRKDGNSPRLSR